MARSAPVTGVRLRPGTDAHAMTTAGAARLQGADRPRGGASVVVAADLFPESAGGRGRRLATGTTGSRDLSPDQRVVPDPLTGNELRRREERGDGNLSTDQTCGKTLKRRGVPHIYFFYFFFINIILAVLFSSVAAVVRVCRFNATAFHLKLLRLFISFFGGECDWSCSAELDCVCVFCAIRGGGGVTAL